MTRRADTRRRLIESAYTLYRETGVRGTSIEVVCDSHPIHQGADHRPQRAPARRRFHDALVTRLLSLIDRLGPRPATDPHSTAITITALYESTLERALLENDVAKTTESHHTTDVLPRLLASLLLEKDMP